MTDTYDIIAINERGVYTICYDEPGDEHVAEFTREALAAGNRVERVTTREACERHRAYLMRRPEFAKLFGLLPYPQLRTKGISREPIQKANAG